MDKWVDLKVVIWMANEIYLLSTNCPHSTLSLQPFKPGGSSSPPMMELFNKFEYKTLNVNGRRNESQPITLFFSVWLKLEVCKILRLKNAISLTLNKIRFKQVNIFFGSYQMTYSSSSIYLISNYRIYKIFIENKRAHIRGLRSQAFFLRREKTGLEATSQIGGTWKILLFCGPVARENSVI